jgi:hypothetical protein
MMMWQWELTYLVLLGIKWYVLERTCRPSRGRNASFQRDAFAICARPNKKKHDLRGSDIGIIASCLSILQASLHTNAIILIDMRHSFA